MACTRVTVFQLRTVIDWYIGIEMIFVMRVREASSATREK